MRLSRGKNGSREAYIWEKGLFCFTLGVCLVYTRPWAQSPAANTEDYTTVSPVQLFMFRHEGLGESACCEVRSSNPQHSQTRRAWSHL